MLTEQRGPRSLDDVSGPWSAWRVWSIIDVDGELRLGSPFFLSRRYWWKRAREVWPVGEPMGELLEPGEAGDPSITGAGVYAGVTKRSVSNFADKYLFDARELGATGCLYVIGTVALWGRRLPGRPGTPELRFEFGYPIELGGIEDMRDVREPSPNVLRERLRDLYRLNDGRGLHDAVAASADQLRTHLSTRYCEDAGGWAHLSGTDARDVASCSAGDGYVDMDALVAALERDSTGGSSHLHGWAHWRQVAAFAMTLARNTPGADPLVALLFGLLHDSQRWSDGYDPAHGERAAELARALNGGPFELSVPQMRRLTFALEEHAEGLLSAEPTIGVCWDADRLALWRLYRRPAASLLSTKAARERIGWARDQGLVARARRRIGTWRVTG